MAQERYTKRFQYHFEPKYGWTNDPNGLCQFRGRYHAFFQHNPYDVRWSTMYWGHAVSDDLVHWEELDIAMRPDMPYESSGGCFSGSAVVWNDTMYLFYTSVSHELGQTQSLCISHDGVHFEKYAGNPIIPKSPIADNPNFRDPKVFRWHDSWRMVVGAGDSGVGCVLLFGSDDLFHWNYMGKLYENPRFPNVNECPDFFPLGDKWVLYFSAQHKPSTPFVIGTFDGERFVPEDIQFCELGKDFYAPQTFADDSGRRIIIGWLMNRLAPLTHGSVSCGGFSIPRELKLINGRLTGFPVSEAQPFLTDSHPDVSLDGLNLTIRTHDGVEPYVSDLSVARITQVEDIKVLSDEKLIEVFVNAGQASVTRWTE